MGRIFPSPGGAHPAFITGLTEPVRHLTHDIARDRLVLAAIEEITGKTWTVVPPPVMFVGLQPP